MFSLLNRGIIPRDVDLSPAFERGSAPFAFTKANISVKAVQKPKHLAAIVSSNKGRKTLPPFTGPEPGMSIGQTFITQLAGHNVQEHMNRLNANMTKHSVNTAERAGATAVDAFSKANRSNMDKSKMSHHDRVQAEKQPEKPATGERRVVDTSNYQLAVRNEDQMRMTGNSYMQNTVTAGELDNFHVYEAMKQQENEYMA